MAKKKTTRDPEHRKPRRRRSSLIRGSLITNRRLERLWTQRDLAKVSGLSERLVRLAEGGGPIESNSIGALATALGIPAEMLVLANAAQSTKPSMAANAKRFLEQIWNVGNMDVINELLLPEFRFHHELGVVTDREEMRQRILAFRSSFSEFDFRVEDSDDYGDFVVCRWRVDMTHSGPWLSLATTNRRVTVFGSSWVRVVEDLFGDAWDFWDPERLYRELQEE